MLKISKMADYGTIILTAMVDESVRTRSAAEIAELTGLPLPSVGKILKKFVSKGLVLSLRGSKGGYKLSRAPETITTAQILEAIDGPLGMTECSSNPGRCGHESACRVRANWQMVSRTMRQALEQITLSQIAQPVNDAMTLTVLRKTPPTVGQSTPVVIGEPS